MNNTSASMAELFPVMQEILQSGGEFRLFPQGTSMLPLLKQGVDSVILRTDNNIKKGDICLYKRNNGDFVLHRVIKVAKNDTLVFRGDNQTKAEPDVKREQIIAKVVCVMHGENAVKPLPFWYGLTRLSAPARALRFRARKAKK